MYVCVYLSTLSNKNYKVLLYIRNLNGCVRTTYYLFAKDTSWGKDSSCLSSCQCVQPTKALIFSKNKTAFDSFRLKGRTILTYTNFHNNMIFFLKWTVFLAKGGLIKLNIQNLLIRQQKTDILVMILHGLKQRDQPASVSFCFTFKSLKLKQELFLLKLKNEEKNKFLFIQCFCPLGIWSKEVLWCP